MLQFSFPSIAFTSEISDLKFRLDSQASTLDFQLSCGAEILHSQRYYAIQNYVTVRDIRSILEQYLRNNLTSMATFTIQAEGKTYQFTVVYCEAYWCADPAKTFLPENFLTTARTKRLPASGYDRLSFIADSSDSSYSILCTFTTSDSPSQLSYTRTVPFSSAISEPSLIYLDIDISEILDDIQSHNDSPVTLSSVTVRAGNRSMTYYIEGATPTDRFFFRNLFNVLEVAQFSCITTDKTSVSRSVATCNGSATFYDQSIAKTYEVETAPLLRAEALWLEQLLTSRNASHAPEGCASSAPILITAITSEISNSDTTLTTLKFTYRYESSRPAVALPEETNIFTDPFTIPFT
jgi:hypothetical protein